MRTYIFFRQVYIAQRIQACTINTGHKKADAFDCPAFTTDPTVDEKSDPEKVFIIYHTIVTPLKVGSYDLDFSAKGVFNRDIDIDDLMGMSLIDRMMSMGGGRQIPFEIQMPAKK